MCVCVVDLSSGEGGGGHFFYIRARFQCSFVLFFFQDDIKHKKKEKKKKKKNVRHAGSRRPDMGLECVTTENTTIHFDEKV